MRAGRIGRRTRLRPEAVAAYKEWHTKVWPELHELDKAAGVRNFSIYIDGNDLFAYCEVDDVDAVLPTVNDNEVLTKWLQLMAPFMDAPDPMRPWVELEEIFHQD